MTDDTTRTPAEEYREALLSWDTVHATYKAGQASDEDDIAAWDRRKAAFSALKDWEDSTSREA